MPGPLSSPLPLALLALAPPKGTIKSIFRSTLAALAPYESINPVMLNLELSRRLLPVSSSGVGTGISSQWELVMVDSETREDRYEDA